MDLTGKQRPGVQNKWHSRMGKVYQNQYVFLRQRAREKDTLSLSTRTRLAYEGRSSYFNNCWTLNMPFSRMSATCATVQNVTVNEIYFIIIDTLNQKECITLIKGDSKYFYMVTK